LDVDGYPDETGQSYEANARQKATFGRDRVAAEAWTLGEDAGIEVDALGGRPGVHSARWSDDPQRQLLAVVAGAADRSARYRCVMVALAADGREIVAQGRLEGALAYEPRGSEGFGYDPIFVPEGETRTVAELGNEWKARNSARARAAAALRAALAAS
jgi:XTP/dITP diphosphohydrolase